MSKALFRIIMILFAAFVCSIHLTAQNNDFVSVEPLPEGVSIHQLDNGIQVLLIENPALPMVGVNTIVKVGSAYETFASSGMSHMLEHLLFNGTTTMKQKELYDAVDRIGGYNNASTSEYYTNYMMVTPAEHIDEGMRIQAGMLFDSILPEDKFEKEKGIVLEEIARSLAKPNEQMERNVISVIYKGHALSLPTLGTYETIKGMARDDVNNFYKNYYVPNNMIMSVIGNFKSDKMLDTIKEIYGKARPGVVQLPSIAEWGTGFDKLSQDMGNEMHVYHRFYSGDNTKLQIFYPLPDAPLEYYSLLSISLDKKKENIQAGLDKTFPGIIDGIEFQIRNYKISKCLQVTLVLKDDSEVSGVEKYMETGLRNLDLSLTNEVVMAEAVKANTRFLQNVEKPHMFGIYNAGLIAEYGLEAILASYSGAGYQNAAKLLTGSVIGDVNYSLVILQHPSEQSGGAEEDNAIKTELFEGTVTNADIIVRQNSRSNLLAIHYMIKNKSHFEEKYGKDAAKIWHAAFGERMESTGKQKQIAKYGFTFTVNDNPFIPMDNIYLHPSFGYIRVEGLADDVGGAIGFLNDEMLEFVPTEDEFMNASKAGGMSAMMMGRDKSSEMFDKLYKDLIYADTDSAVAPELTYANLLKFGKEYFNPGNMIIAVVSPEPPAEVNKYFSPFYKGDQVEVIEGLAHQKEFKAITQPEKIDEEGGGEQSHLFYGFVKEVDKQDVPAVQALSLLLKDEIIFDIREKQGMAYRMSAGIDIVKDKALFYIRMSTRPENTDKLVPQFPDFFQPSFADKITAEDLERSVNMYLGRMMFRRLSSINQAYYLSYSYYYDGDINEDQRMLDALKNVTLSEVKSAAVKYLKVDNPVQVVVR